MIANSQLRRTLAGLGYKSSHVFTDYRFAAVDKPDLPVRETSIAAFFDSPPSYRNAALGIVRVGDELQPEALVASQRALGAPFLIAIGVQRVSAWAFTPNGPRKFDEAPISEWERFSSKHAGVWRADAVRRVKAIHLRTPKPSQDALFDPATLYAIQTQVQLALEALLKGFLGFFESVPNKSTLSLQRDYELLFPLVFRLLAAKILYDREDPRLNTVDKEDVEGVIQAVSHLYSLSPLPIRWTVAIRTQLRRAWSTLLQGLYVRNIAADDLAFIYENTLITTETRKTFGTHSTPPAVAEYMVRSFNLPHGSRLESLRVFEPFAGSCVFLTAAMRRFKELLPGDWSPARMHKHLVSHFGASELDQFACEIARLSLILADYPNANGWHIHNEDLFDDGVLANRVKKADMVICNPPFEAFETPNGLTSIHKPIAALDAIIAEAPAYLGIVMPPGFGSHKKYREVVDHVVQKYKDVELLELPEGIFKRARVGAVALIAQRPREAATGLTTIRRSTVRRAEREMFERTLQPSSVEAVAVNPIRDPGFSGLRPLRDVWEYLADYQRLGAIAQVHRGLEWKSDQRLASSRRPQRGYREGLHRIDNSLAQFRVQETVYMDCRPESARGGALQLPWQKSKIICSAVRMSRGPWRLAACADEKGLVLSQQFFGIWLSENSKSLTSLSGLTAVLNSPLVNAFSFAHDSEMRLRVEVMKQVPIPPIDIGPQVRALIREYVSTAEQAGPLFAEGSRTLEDILMEIDACVLSAYDLPPKLEKALLKFMNEGQRPCNHPFGPYRNANQPGAIPLRLHLLNQHETISSREAVWRELLSPLPLDVANVFDIA